MKAFFSFCLVAMFFGSSAQTQANISLEDSLKKYFNYDTLHNVSCEKVPTGIYGLSFHVEKDYSVSDISFSADTLPILRQLLTEALQKAVARVQLASAPERYLQLIYYNDILGCNNTNDPIFNYESKDKQLEALRKQQLLSFERSFRQLVLQSEKFIVLKGVYFENGNPMAPRSRGFANDYREVKENDLDPKIRERILEEKGKPKKKQK